MKIAFVSPEDNLSGGLRVIAIYAERLQKRGHQVLVVAPRRRTPTLKERARTLIREGRWSLAPTGSYFKGRNIQHRTLERHRPVEDSDLPSQYTWDDAAALFESALELAISRAARGEIAGGQPHLSGADSSIRS